MTTILQITDPHLMSDRQGTLKGIPTANTLSSVLDAARVRCPEPDGIVWTGDLSHEESVAGYELLRQIAGDWIDKSFLVPGNHDDRVAIRQVFPEIPGTGQEMISFRQELGPWQLIGIDTQVPGETEGELSAEQLTQLHYWLTLDPERPTLMFMHHPPGHVGCPWLDQIGLRNPEPLENMLSSYRGPVGIFCGHVHHVYQGVFAGARLFTSPSAAFQFNSDGPPFSFDLLPPGFRVITLDDEDFTTEVIRCPRMAYQPDES